MGSFKYSCTWRLKYCGVEAGSIGVLYESIQERNEYLFVHLKYYGAEAGSVHWCVIGKYPEVGRVLRNESTSFVRSSGSFKYSCICKYSCFKYSCTWKYSCFKYSCTCKYSSTWKYPGWEMSQHPSLDHRRQTTWDNSIFGWLGLLHSNFCSRSQVSAEHNVHIVDISKKSQVSKTVDMQE